MDIVLPAFHYGCVCHFSLLNWVRIFPFVNFFRLVSLVIDFPY